MRLQKFPESRSFFHPYIGQMIGLACLGSQEFPEGRCGCHPETQWAALPCCLGAQHRPEVRTSEGVGPACLGSAECPEGRCGCRPETQWAALVWLGYQSFPTAPLLTEKIVDGLVNPARGSRGNQQVGIAPRISCLGTPNGKIKN